MTILTINDNRKEVKKMKGFVSLTVVVILVLGVVMLFGLIPQEKKATASVNVLSESKMAEIAGGACDNHCADGYIACPLRYGQPR